MSRSDEFYESLEYDGEDRVVWPAEPGERRRVAEGLFGSKVIEAVEETADEMLGRIDGRWPSPGSMSYEEDIKVAEVFKSMSTEQRNTVAALVSEAVRLTGYSIFVALEHLGAGTVEVSVHPISRGTLDGAAVPVEPGEWHVGYLSWEGRFGRSG